MVVGRGRQVGSNHVQARLGVTVSWPMFAVVGNYCGSRVWDRGWLGGGVHKGTSGRRPFRVVNLHTCYIKAEIPRVTPTPLVTPKRTPARGRGSDPSLLPIALGLKSQSIDHAGG